MEFWLRTDEIVALCTLGLNFTYKIVNDILLNNESQNITWATLLRLKVKRKSWFTEKCLHPRNKLENLQLKLAFTSD